MTTRPQGTEPAAAGPVIPGREVAGFVVSARAGSARRRRRSVRRGTTIRRRHRDVPLEDDFLEPYDTRVQAFVFHRVKGLQVTDAEADNLDYVTLLPPLEDIAIQLFSRKDLAGWHTRAPAGATFDGETAPDDFTVALSIWDLERAASVLAQGRRLRPEDFVGLLDGQRLWVYSDLANGYLRYEDMLASQQETDQLPSKPIQ